MLLRAKMLKNSELDSLDGEIGKVKEFYFDDLHWTIRYLVADTGGWISGRRVLISPQALAGAIGTEKHIAVNLTKKQIESQPVDQRRQTRFAPAGRRVARLLRMAALLDNGAIRRSWLSRAYVFARNRGGQFNG